MPFAIAVSAFSFVAGTLRTGFLRPWFSQAHGLGKLSLYFLYPFPIAESTVALSSFFVQKNQSWHVTPSCLPSILSLATPQEPAVGTMASSPGRQSAGVATPKASAVFKAWTTRMSSSNFG